jgi:hypothetical protein
MNDFTNKLYNELTEDLNLFADLGALPVRRVTGALAGIRDCLDALKKYTTEHPFDDEQSEINFFKYEKPKFLAEQIYVLEITAIQTNRPLYDAEAIRHFYEQELKNIRRFFEQYKFLYQYYLMDANDFDRMLFVRGASAPGILLPERPDLDPAFATAGDYTFARFMAYERLQAFLIEEISGTDKSATQDSTVTETGLLKWTGESINLVELAYGMWLTGQVNNGNVSITEIIEWLEAHFRVKIGKAHRRWQSISRRKRIASFKYVDELKEALVKRLDDELAK